MQKYKILGIYANVLLWLFVHFSVYGCRLTGLVKWGWLLVDAVFFVCCAFFFLFVVLSCFVVLVF